MAGPSGSPHFALILRRIGRLSVAGGTHGRRQRTCHRQRGETWPRQQAGIDRLQNLPEPAWQAMCHGHLTALTPTNPACAP